LSQAEKNFNCYDYCAEALTERNRILYATPAFQSYLRAEGRNPLLDKNPGEATKKAIEDTFREGFFNRKTLFYYFYAILKKQPRADSSAAGISVSYVPTQAMADAFGWAVVRKRVGGKDVDMGVNAITIGNLLRDTDFFQKSPVITARRSANLAKKVDSNDIFAYVKPNPTSKGSTANYLGNMGSAVNKLMVLETVKGDRMDIGTKRSPKTGKVASLGVVAYVRAFKYEMIGDIFQVTQFVINAAKEDLMNKKYDEHAALAQRLSGKR